MSAISCQQRPFGTLETGQAITCYSLRNTSGMTVNLLNYGAILNSIQIPNIRGEMHEITLGPSQLSDLSTDTFHSGSTLSHLPQRYGINLNQIGKTLWHAESKTQDNLASVQLSTEGSIPLKYSLTTKLQYQLTTEYTLTATDELIICSHIQTSLSLPLFITHHPYWNLMGDTQKGVSDHILQVWASQYAELDPFGFTTSPTLEIQENPAFNFQQPQRIEEKRIATDDSKPYEVCFTLEDKDSLSSSDISMPLAARVKAPVSGRTLEVYTTQPALRFYLPSHPTQGATGLCLSPMPLLSTDTKEESLTTLKQETCYKLIW